MAIAHILCNSFCCSCAFSLEVFVSNTNISFDAIFLINILHSFLLIQYFFENYDEKFRIIQLSGGWGCLWKPCGGEGDGSLAHLEDEGAPLVILRSPILIRKTVKES